MVILDICRHLLANNQIKGVWAIHMEYINREEDGAKETEFLKEYCQTLKIPIIVRKIHYMRRDDVDREFYEEETRKARFTTYRYMMREFGIETFCLGHHSGDLAENVLMNIFKGRDILDLFVMNETEDQFGVNISRPLLPHPKLEIFEYAEENHIPYFKDTTPNWSCRGVLRRKILPRLERQWGEGIYNTLAAVGKNSTEWGAVIENAVIQPFLKSVERCDDGFKFAVTLDLLNYPRVFWHKILMDLFHSYGCKMISNKNLDSMLEMLKKRFNSRDTLKLAFSNGCSGEFACESKNQREFAKNILTINVPNFINN
jgi:tRNA(Ile)-lysidine synthetase-like protein